MDTVKAEDSQVLSTLSVRRQLLNGYLHSVPIPHSRVVRIFVSCSFSGKIYTFLCLLPPKVEEALSDGIRPSFRLSVRLIPKWKIGAFQAYDYCRTLIGNSMLEGQRSPMTTGSDRNSFDL